MIIKNNSTKSNHSNCTVTLKNFGLNKSDKYSPVFIYDSDSNYKEYNPKIPANMLFEHTSNQSKFTQKQKKVDPVKEKIKKFSSTFLLKKVEKIEKPEKTLINKPNSKFHFDPIIKKNTKSPESNIIDLTNSENDCKDDKVDHSRLDSTYECADINLQLSEMNFFDYFLNHVEENQSHEAFPSCLIEKSVKINNSQNTNNQYNIFENYDLTSLDEITCNATSQKDPDNNNWDESNYFN